MSWDVVMVRTKTNGEALKDIAGENIVPFTQTEIAEAVKNAAAVLGAAYDCADLSYQHLGCGGWSIEFNVGGETEAESVMLHVRANPSCCTSEARRNRKRRSPSSLPH